ncbi:MAG: YkvA family protein [Chloroflexota bacterium]
MDLLVAVLVGLVAAWLLFLVLLWLLRPRDARVRELVRVVPDVVRLCRDVLSDGQAPRSVRVAIAGLLVYLVSPIDLTPDFIPVLGPLDDIVVAILVLRYVRRRLGVEPLRDRWRGTPEGFELLRSVMG